MTQNTLQYDIYVNQQCIVSHEDIEYNFLIKNKYKLRPMYLEWKCVNLDHLVIDRNIEYDSLLQS